MDRRSFLKLFGATAALGTAAVVAGVEIDLEKELWLPGRKTFFLPPEQQLISGEAAMKEMASLDRDGGLYHYTQTALGQVVSDARWNVISVRGKPVTPREAAKLRLSNFSRGGFDGKSAKVVADMETQIIGERIQAGWTKPGGYYTGMQDSKDLKQARRGWIRPTDGREGAAGWPSAASRGVYLPNGIDLKTVLLSDDFKPRRKLWVG